MLIPGELGALSFKKINITKFLKKYEELSADFSLSESEAIKRILQYCEITIR